MKRYILVVCFGFAVCLLSYAQDVKEVVVSSDSPYEETMDVDCDVRGLSLAVHISYDEKLDVIALSLVPDRPVVFFREDQEYDRIFKRGKKLKPECISYPIQVTPAAQFKLASAVYKTYSKKRRAHIYNKWMGNLSKEVTPMAPEITESGNTVPLVTTDSLLQRFQLNPSISKFSFKIRNVLTADLKKKKKNGKSKYEFKGEKDLNQCFSVTVKRNPCFNTDHIRTMLESRVQEIKRAYTGLHNACPNGVATSEAEVGVFSEHQYYLLAQFPPMDIQSQCSDVISESGIYNSYVDSIRNATCSFNPSLEEQILPQKENEVPTDVLVSTARRLNSLAIKLMRSTDRYECRDLTLEGKTIIKNVQRMIDENGVKGEDREEALALFRESKAFLERIIANKNSR